MQDNSKPQPFTLRHFEQWASQLILDSGEPWTIEPFQALFVEDLFSGSPENWLVVPEGNGKTTLVAGLALYHCQFQLSASVPVAASSRDQAELIFRQAEGFIIRSESLHDGFKAQEGYRRIKYLPLGSRIQVFPADDRSGDGVLPTLCIIDELHRQRDLRLYRTWRGKLAKRNGQILTISTAGEPNSEFEDIRAKIKIGTKQKDCFTRIHNREITFHEYSVPTDGNSDDLQLVKQANPFSGVTLPLLKEKHDSPTMNVPHWRRFVCNLPTRIVDSWLSDGQWEANESTDEIEPGEYVYVGMDLGFKTDHSAVVTVAKHDGNYVARAAIFATHSDPTEPAPLAHFIFEQEVQSHRAVLDYVLELSKRNPIQELAYDPYGALLIVEELESQGIQCVEIPQTNRRMARATDILYSLIANGKLLHNGDPYFSRHIDNATVKWVGEGMRLWKDELRSPMDSAVALAIAISRAHEAEEAAPTVRFLDFSF